jgi:hypothetical protein
VKPLGERRDVAVEANMRYVGLSMLALFLAVGIARAEGPAVVAVPGAPTLVLSSFDLAPLGYVTEEFFISGTASSYTLAGAPTSDGVWNVRPAATAPFTTRIVVVRPTDPKKFNGTVVVEWLNVSGGVDAGVDWNTTHREITRNGYAYVAVSAQKVGIDGGPSIIGTSTPLKKSNPERYGRLVHPGDAFSYDMFSQAGQAVRSTDTVRALGPLVPQRVLAIGESQSAMFMTTYVNAVDPLAKVYDGFLIHSRFGNASSLDNAGMAGARGQPRVIKQRPDLRVPVITVIMETDLLDSGIAGYHAARQGDHDRLRVWEVPGTSHADNYTFTLGAIDSGSLPIEKLAAGFEPTNKILGADLAKPINNAPQHHYVVQAALWNLDRWVKTGRAPAKAVPLRLAESKPGAPVSVAVDRNGLAEGGVRTPWVDVPTARLSGVGNSGGPVAFLAGVSEPFDAATLARLYPGGKRDYLKKFEASLDSTIKAGFILPADRKEILALAAAMTYRGSK